jgi:hypothetical protein
MGVVLADTLSQQRAALVVPDAAVATWLAP